MLVEPKFDVHVAGVRVLDAKVRDWAEVCFLVVFRVGPYPFRLTLFDVGQQKFVVCSAG